MEIQEFAPRHLYSQLAFRESQASIIDRRGSTAKAMTDHLKLSNVTLHPTAAEVTTEDGRDHYRIGIAQTFAGLLNFEDLEDACLRTSSFLKMGLAYLDNPSVASAQVRTYDIAPASSFTELRDRLAEKLAAGSAQLKEALGMPFKDVGWVFEFDQPEVAAKVQFGAMESDQLRGILQDPDGTDYPPALLFVALETAFQASDQNASNGVEWWSHCVDRNRKMAENVGNWLKGTVE